MIDVRLVRDRQKKNLFEKPTLLHASLGVSLRGRLAFPVRVKYRAEALACQLAGEKPSDACLLVDLWRRALQLQGSKREYEIEDAIKGFPPTLAPFMRIALAVRALRKDERRWPLRVGTMGGLLCITSGSLRASSRARPEGKESLDVTIAFADVSRLDHAEFSFGLSFGAIGVRVVEGGRIDGLVVWDGNRGAQTLYDMLAWRHLGQFAEVEQREQQQRCARRCAGHALRREARRLLRVSRRLLAERQRRQRQEGGAHAPEAKHE